MTRTDVAARSGQTHNPTVAGSIPAGPIDLALPTLCGTVSPRLGASHHIAPENDLSGDPCERGAAAMERGK